MLQANAEKSPVSTPDLTKLIENKELAGAVFQAILEHLADLVTERVLVKLNNTNIQTTQPVTQPVTQEETSPVSSEAPIKKKKIVSDEIKKRISESQKVRWANRKKPLDTEPVSSPAPEGLTLATLEGYKGDDFYINEEGNFVGDDGFIVPKDFSEFFKRYPKYIEAWVRRRLRGSGSEEDIEDWTQELLIHMKYLPPTSKHRSKGKEDVFQTFDPFSQYGAGERRWRSYINYCLTNKYNTIYGKRSKNPVCRSGNMALVADTSGDTYGEVTDEYVYSKSEYLMDATNREEMNKEKRFFTQKFIKYVKDHDEAVYPVLMAIYESGSSSDTIKEFCKTCKKLATTMEIHNGSHIGHEVGITPKEFNRAKNKLKQLANHFMEQKPETTTAVVEQEQG